MPLEKIDQKVNLGHERKRKRMEDKIRKAGTKQPRRCDKESSKTYTSPYFSTSQNITTNSSQTYLGATTTQMTALPNLPFTTRPLSNISNLPQSSSTSTVGLPPQGIRAIRFLSPLNIINIPQKQPQQNLAFRPP